MIHGRKSWWRLFAGLAVLISSTACAGSLTFSFGGTVQAVDAGVADPWGLGSTATQFVVDATVPLDSNDIASSDVADAVFTDGVAVRLWVDGQPLQFSANSGRIDFFDGQAEGGLSAIDVLVIEGVFLRGVAPATFRALAAIPQTSISFGSFVEPPPAILSTVTTGQGEYGGDIYRTLVPVDTPVTVVPEPVSYAILLSSVGIVTCSRRR
jgi:hypothetical protein